MEGSMNFLFLFLTSHVPPALTGEGRVKMRATYMYTFLCAQPCGNLLVNTPTFVVVALQVEPRAWYVLSEHSITEPHQRSTK